MKIINVPSIKEFEAIQTTTKLLSQYLKEQSFGTYAVDLYQQKFFVDGNGKEIKLLVSEPITFHILYLKNKLDVNIHVGIDIVSGNDVANTLYLIDNGKIDRLDESLYFYKNESITNYLVNIELIRNSKIDSTVNFLKSFDIHNIMYNHYQNFNQYEELEHLIEKYLEKYV